MSWLLNAEVMAVLNHERPVQNWIRGREDVEMY
jgi:hypothetical protein